MLLLFATTLDPLVVNSSIAHLTAIFNFGVIQSPSLSLQVIILLGTYLEIKPTKTSMNTVLISFTFKLKNSWYPKISSEYYQFVLI